MGAKGFLSGQARRVSAALVAWSLWLGCASPGAALAEPPGGNLVLQRPLGQAWRQVETFARAQLDDPDLDPHQRLRCLQGLSESYRFQGRPAEAIPRLEQLLRVQEQLRDQAGKRDALRLLAGHLAANRRLA